MNLHNLAVRFSARGVFVLFLLTALTSSFAHAFGANKVDVWLTTPDKRYLLAEQPTRLPFTKASPNAKAIVVDDQMKFQTMDGFGHALTGGTAQLMMKMTPAARAALLRSSSAMVLLRLGLVIFVSVSAPLT